MVISGLHQGSSSLSICILQITILSIVGSIISFDLFLPAALLISHRAPWTASSQGETMRFMDKLKDLVHKESGSGSSSRKVFAHYMVRPLDTHCCRLAVLNTNLQSRLD